MDDGLMVASYTGGLVYVHPGFPPSSGQRSACRKLQYRGAQRDTSRYAVRLTTYTQHHNLTSTYWRRDPEYPLAPQLGSGHLVSPLAPHWLTTSHCPNAPRTDRGTSSGRDVPYCHQPIIHSKPRTHTSEQDCRRA